MEALYEPTIALRCMHLTEHEVSLALREAVGFLLYFVKLVKDGLTGRGRFDV